MKKCIVCSIWRGDCSNKCNSRSFNPRNKKKAIRLEKFAAKNGILGVLREDLIDTSKESNNSAIFKI